MQGEMVDLGVESEITESLTRIEIWMSNLQINILVLSTARILEPSGVSEYHSTTTIEG